MKTDRKQFLRSWGIILVLVLGFGMGILAQASLEVEPHIISLEPKRSETTATFRFVLKNTGEMVETISEVRSSCPCLEVVDAPKELAAGATSEFFAVLQLNPMGGEQAHGIFVKTESKTEPLMLRAVAKVQALAETEPKFLFWQKGSEKRPQTFRFVLTKEEVVTLQDVFAVDENFQTKRKRLEDGSYEVEVTPVDLEITRPAMVMIAVKVAGREEPISLGVMCQIGERNPFVIDVRPFRERSPDLLQVEEALKDAQALVPNEIPLQDLGSKEAEPKK